MKGIILKKPGEFELAERPVPVIENSDEILVKIEAASICGSDLHIFSNPPGIKAVPGTIIGHEFVGRVVKTGSEVHGFKEGDRLVCDPNISCGHCSYCKMGLPNMCVNMKTLGVELDGGFAEYCVLPEKAAVKISQDLSADRAVFAEPLTCVMNGMNKIRLMPGETAAVLGAGPIGLYFVKLLRQNGAGKIFVSETSSYRAEYAAKYGADMVVNPTKENFEEMVKAQTEGLGADVVIDAVGSLLAQAVRTVRRGGKILLFGYNDKAVSPVEQGVITRHDLTVMGNWIGLFTLPATVRLLESEAVDFEISHRISLEEFGSGLNAMRRGTALKVVIYPN